ncbi:phosphatidylglycerol:prolipoprotein diacylglycerol transferase [Modestobacter sp. DSM 44400]|uniref:prolipoprotein diacylglyceryl transferase n=1 Tax=Modestobacter sp. DSM 44400 TaxID=1550230 RepID=UPI000899B4EC|nr:prolipoprotein diacylglyceryl transferase [Modestobacter sp. DSM 44400]SDY65676.1 phosphatidylglycerol:prolipoprotein diacylglycerol transferase [Modestobacter sp. DSM 44400]
MRPVLFEVFGLPINSYGVSKAAAALVAGYLLAREFRRLGWDGEKAWSMVGWATVAGFAGGKLYYLAEHAASLSPHSFGPAGFTWYGGLIAGSLTVVVLARRHRIPLTPLAGIVAAPLSIAYGIGRIGCFLAGDGTYGKPSDLPWAMAFPHGTVPTLVRVHPTALYEAALALALGALLWAVRTRLAPLTVFGLYAAFSGIARFLVEEVRINREVLLGLTQPQLWSLLLVAGGIALLLTGRRTAVLAAVR